LDLPDGKAEDFDLFDAGVAPLVWPEPIASFSSSLSSDF